jgi:hypothetical protein
VQERLPTPGQRNPPCRYTNHDVELPSDPAKSQLSPKACLAIRRAQGIKWWIDHLDEINSLEMETEQTLQAVRVDGRREEQHHVVSRGEFLRKGAQVQFAAPADVPGVMAERDSHVAASIALGPASDPFFGNEITVVRSREVHRATHIG